MSSAVLQYGSSLVFLPCMYAFTLTRYEKNATQATAWGARGRGFESRRPDQIKSKTYTENPAYFGDFLKTSATHLIRFETFRFEGHTCIGCVREGLSFESSASLLFSSYSLNESTAFAETQREGSARRAIQGFILCRGTYQRADLTTHRRAAHFLKSKTLRGHHGSL
jgi:hypothetical protein